MEMSNLFGRIDTVLFAVCADFESLNKLRVHYENEALCCYNLAIVEWLHLTLKGSRAILREYTTLYQPICLS